MFIFTFLALLLQNFQWLLTPLVIFLIAASSPPAAAPGIYYLFYVIYFSIMSISLILSSKIAMKNYVNLILVFVN